MGGHVGLGGPGAAAGDEHPAIRQQRGAGPLPDTLRRGATIVHVLLAAS